LFLSLPSSNLSHRLNSSSFQIFKWIFSQVTLIFCDSWMYSSQKGTLFALCTSRNFAFPLLKVRYHVVLTNVQKHVFIHFFLLPFHRKRKDIEVLDSREQPLQRSSDYHN
jgi:hypothetical protein